MWEANPSSLLESRSVICFMLRKQARKQLETGVRLKLLVLFDKLLDSMQQRIKIEKSEGGDENGGGSSNTLGALISSIDVIRPFFNEMVCCFEEPYVLRIHALRAIEKLWNLNVMSGESLVTTLAVAMGDYGEGDGLFENRERALRLFKVVYSKCPPRDLFINLRTTLVKVFEFQFDQFHGDIRLVTPSLLKRSSSEESGDGG